VELEGEILDELIEDQLVLSMSLSCLDELVEHSPRDPSARAAQGVLCARIADLMTLRDALALVQLALVASHTHALVAPDASLSDYLRGVYSWTHALVRAFEDLARSLVTLEPDWAQARWRIEEARNFHFDELHEPIRSDLLAASIMSDEADVAAIEALAHAVANLFAHARNLDSRLEERFG
jgi:hypothetical protein